MSYNSFILEPDLCVIKECRMEFHICKNRYKEMKKVFALVLVLSVAFCFIACGGASSSLLGRWELEPGQPTLDNIKEVELLKDGLGIVGEQVITWKVENNRFYANLPWWEGSWGYKLSGDVLTLTNDDGTNSIYKKKGASQISGAGEKSLNGTWELSNDSFKIIVEFEGNKYNRKIVGNDGEVWEEINGTYSITGNKIVLKDKDHEQLFIFQRDGDTLTTVGLGYQSQYTKIASTSSGKSSGNVSAVPNGTWIDSREGSFGTHIRIVSDNGNWEMASRKGNSGTWNIAARGTFTVAGNTIKMNATHMNRSAFGFTTGPQWLDQNAIRTALIDQFSAERKRSPNRQELAAIDAEIKNEILAPMSIILNDNKIINISGETPIVFTRQ